jgi:uncharacterized protein YukJ
MNERLKDLAIQAGFNQMGIYSIIGIEDYHQKFAKLVIEAVLDQVKERAYYTGDRDWSDNVDRPWIQLEFGYGSLHDAKLGIFK